MGIVFCLVFHVIYDHSARQQSTYTALNFGHYCTLVPYLHTVVDARVVSSGSAEDVTITRGDNSQSSVSIPGAVISEEEGTVYSWTVQ